MKLTKPLSNLLSVFSNFQTGFCCNARTDPFRLAPACRMSRRGFLKAALGAVGIGLTAGIVGPQVLTNVARAQDPAQPAVFAEQSFEFRDEFSNPKTLTFLVLNEKGEKNGFTDIATILKDNYSNKVTKGRVGALLDAPEKGIASVFCVTFDGEKLITLDDPNIFQWVKKWVGSKWNKSDIIIEKGGTATPKGKPEGVSPGKPKGGGSEGVSPSNATKSLTPKND